MKYIGTLIATALCLMTVPAAVSQDQKPAPAPAATQGAATTNVIKQPASTPAQSDANKLPDSASYRPLTNHEKLSHWAKRTYSPYTFAGAAFDATWAHAVGDWPQYGGGMQGWAKRYGAVMGNTQIRTFLGQFMYPALLRQDPRYFSSPYKGLIPRGWYAATRVLYTRADDGNEVLNTSEWLAVASTAALQNAYYPERDRGLSETMGRVVGSIGSDITSNLLREFWPDIKRIVRKRAPERMKKIPDKIPGMGAVMKNATEGD